MRVAPSGFLSVNVNVPDTSAGLGPETAGGPNERLSLAV
jgi:hypothetical protein